LRWVYIFIVWARLTLLRGTYLPVWMTHWVLSSTSSALLVIVWVTITDLLLAEERDSYMVYKGLGFQSEEPEFEP